jgi:opacity protein-like surface antigen
MKKILFVLFPVLMATSAFADKDYYVYADRGADSTLASRNDFNGPYIKVATGLALPSITLADEGQPAAMQIPLVGSLGFSHVWNQFYAGIEGQLGWNFIAQKTGYSPDGTNLAYNPKWQTMATVQIGGVISQTNIIYADGGYALGDFKYMDGAAEKSVYQNGPTFGVGTSLQLSDHVNFDMNYHFIYYLSKNTPLGNFKVKQNLVTAGLSFHF